MPTRNPPREKDDFAEGLSEPLPFQHREWVVQRLGWTLMALVVLAGLLGLFGNGPLAHRTVSNESLQLEFDWLARDDAPTTWKVTPRAPPVDGVYRVALDQNWAQYFRIVAIQPQPTTAQLADAQWVYEFEAHDARPTRIVFHVEPRRVGTLAGSIRLNGGPPLAMQQFIYP